MTDVLRRWIDQFRGSGEFSLAVPPFDGALRPNGRIDAGRIVCEVADPDNLVALDAGVACSSGAELLRLPDPAGPAASAPPRVLERYAAPIAALAVHEDTLAVGLDGQGIVIRGGVYDGRRYAALGAEPLRCPVALAFEGPRHLLIAQGSARHPAARWKHDLLEGRPSGSVWRVDLDSGEARLLAANLAYPYGVLPLPGGAVLVAESWRHRLLRIDADGTARAVLEGLPAYPSRLAADGQGGAWLALFAPRRRIVELVLREPGYRQRMMAEIPSEYWISPTLAPMSHFLEPLQGGTLKKLARTKPWAPSRSYGLIARLNERWQPVDSLHSRADGTRHGIRSVLPTSSGLLAASVGVRAIIALDV